MNTDITAPPTTEPAPPISDVKQPPAETQNSQPAGAPPPTAKKQEAPKAAPTQKPSKPVGSGVTAAIVATVVIVLGLAALATYAYLQTR